MREITGSGESLLRSVDSLPLRAVVRVPGGASIGELARRMREEDVSLVLVGGDVRKIVTERDLTQALADGRGPGDPVSPVANRTPLWVTTNSRVVDVAQMMVRHGIRHLIVVKPTAETVGVVSMRDVFATLVPPAALGPEPN